MALTRYDSRSDFGLCKPVSLNFFNDVLPVHGTHYRTDDLESKRLYDIFFSQNSDMDTFGERVRETRKKLKLTQKQLAKLSGMAQATLSDIERGKNAGSRDVVALATALKVSAEWLINGEQGGDSRIVDSVNSFVSVYKASTEEGRTFLMNAVKAVAVGFRNEDRRTNNDVIPITNRRKQ